MLQGPVGPFFQYLQTHLADSGFDVWRICFNPADLFFSRRGQRIHFHGNLENWEAWFGNFVEGAQVDRIVLFGAERPIHRIARQIGSQMGIPVVSLEEGYIRPGFITAEEGGNNASSPLAGQLPPPTPLNPEPTAGEDFRSFSRMACWGALYYALRSLLTVGKQRQLFHRTVSIHTEIFCWARNGWRRLAGQSRNFSTIQKLLEHWDKNYYLVPLQVETDLQMQDAALGWCHIRLISAVMKSFSTRALGTSRLVFKIHPLNRGHTNLGGLIHQTALAYGIEERVDVIDTGSLGLLTRHSAGLITINSSSGLSAIYHGVPLLVVGKALYAHPKLAVCACGNPDFDSFWNSKHVAPAPLRKAFLNWVRQEALVAGDFYSARGIRQGCTQLLPRIIEASAVKAAEKPGRKVAC